MHLSHGDSSRGVARGVGLGNIGKIPRGHDVKNKLGKRVFHFSGVIEAASETCEQI